MKLLVLRGWGRACGPTTRVFTESGEELTDIIAISAKEPLMQPKTGCLEFYGEFVLIDKEPESKRPKKSKSRK